MEEAKEGSEEVEEARNPKVARRPIAPTKAMREAHEVHHADYREWCEHCVAGKGVSHQHRAAEKEDNGTAEYGLDYAFMTNDGQIGNAEEIGENRMAGASPVIVGYDRQSKGVWAMAVESKGAQDSSVKWVKNKIDESGNSGTKATIRSDQEEAIISLKKAVAIKRQAETVLI